VLSRPYAARAPPLRRLTHVRDCQQRKTEPGPHPDHGAAAAGGRVDGDQQVTAGVELEWEATPRSKSTRVGACRTVRAMSIEIPPGFSVSLPIVITAGPEPAVPDETTPLTTIASADVNKVRIVYPDPTAGVVNPLRSVCIDMAASAVNGAAAAIRGFYFSPYDGTIRTLLEVATCVKPPDAGAASFGAPIAVFRTPLDV